MVVLVAIIMGILIAVAVVSVYFNDPGFLVVIIPIFAGFIILLNLGIDQDKSKYIEIGREQYLNDMKNGVNLKSKLIRTVITDADTTYIWEEID